MKALTLTQPWASLVELGEKWIETRSWRTGHRGPIAIHAGKRKAHDVRLGDWRWQRDTSYLWRPRANRAEIPESYEVSTGAVVAIAFLVDVVPIVEIYDARDGRQVVAGARDLGALTLWEEWPPEVEDTTTRDVSDQLPFGDFTPGRHAWILKNIRPIDPVPASGALHLWEWDAPRSVVPRLNAYACNACNGFTVVLEVDDGHAPDVIACRARGFGTCLGTATNMRYPDPWPDVIPVVPEWEMFNPHARARIPSDENRAVAAAVDALIIRKRRRDSLRITGGVSG